MNFHIIRRIIGLIMAVEAVVMTPALLISAVQGERYAVLGFVAAICLLLALGLPLAVWKPKRKGYYAREGFVTVGLSWITVSLFGALPFCISGAIPNFVDAFFETVSGFTTTGASIVVDVEALPLGLLYWRSFTQWLGGMGVLVFLLAASPLFKGTGESLYLLRAESPGVNVAKLVPRTHRSALILYKIYIALTLLQMLILLFDGLPLFDSLTIAMATAGTGGFSIKNDGLASYSMSAQNIIAVFMVLFSLNFAMLYLLLLRQFKRVFRNEELRLYLGVLLAATVLIAINIQSLFASAGGALQNAFFTVASIMSSTGFVTADFDLWPQVSRSVLLLLMIMGACAGSTGGGAKVIRILILIKSAIRSVRRELHPRAVQLVHIDGEPLSDAAADGVNAYMIIYCLLTAVFTLVLSLEGFDFETTFTSVLTCMNNTGPGMNLSGPTVNFAGFSHFGKLLLSAVMLFGRLELFPMLMLMVPSAWQK